MFSWPYRRVLGLQRMLLKQVRYASRGQALAVRKAQRGFIVYGANAHTLSLTGTHTLIFNYSMNLIFKGFNCQIFAFYI